MRLYDLKTLHMKTPVIDQIPEFSWKIESDRKNVIQERYQIIVKSADEVFWDTGIVVSREQTFIEYKGKPLLSKSKYQWTVTVWNNHGECAYASAEYETALLIESDWKAKWIECSFKRKPANEYKFGNSYPAILFAKTFNIRGEIQSAKIYATSYGVYRLEINNKKPDERELAPEFTPYEKVLYYQTYDATSLLHEGENLLTMFVGDGWYFSTQAGPVTEKRHDEPSCLFQIEITYRDGLNDVIYSDGTENCKTDYIIYSDLYQGEKQDFLSYNDEIAPVVVKDYGYSFLQAQPMDPIIPAKLIPAVDIITTPAGETVVDFGQVMCGRARIHIDAPVGREVILEYFETLNSEGNYVNTMFAPQKDIVISNGKPIVHEALFTFHGFRYIRVTGMEHVNKNDFTAILLTTKKDNTGSFVTSDERLNRLYQNIRWSQFSNMMSIPTDCPSREKAGWTGDILIYAKTALMNEDMTPFLRSWLSSVRTDQADDGVVMIVSPYMNLYDGVLRNVCKTFGDDKITGVAGWSDAIVWVPYDMYLVTGNKLVLSENYDAMQKWAEYIERTAVTKRGYYDIPLEYDQYLWNTGFHFGEWLVPSRPNESPDPYAMCKESAFYIAPFFGYMTMIKMQEISKVLGKCEQAMKYEKIAHNMKNAIQSGILRRNMLPDYLMGAYVLAFAFDLVPEDLMDEFKGRLLNLIHNNQKCLDTGFLATPFLLDTLCELGEQKLAYEIFWQDKRPSWLYEVDHGATTIWEAWDADETKKSGKYVSFNHYAFGCVDDWVCRRIAGINSKTPGYTHVIIDPDVDGGVDFCKRTFESEAGTISVSWDSTKIEVDIPCNSTATVVWKGIAMEIGSGNYVFK